MDDGHGQGIQGACGPQPEEAAGPAVREQWPEPARAVRAPGYEPPGGDPASRGAGGGQSGRDVLAGPREAALPECRAAVRDLRALDREVRAAAPARAARAEEEIGRASCRERV